MEKQLSHFAYPGQVKCNVLFLVSRWLARGLTHQVSENEKVLAQQKKFYLSQMTGQHIFSPVIIQHNWNELPLMYYFKHEKQYFLSIIGIPKHQEES